MEFRFGSIVFSSNFDSGNLLNVEKVNSSNSEDNINNVSLSTSTDIVRPDYDFNIWTRPDCFGTQFENGNRTWFHFSVRGYTPGKLIRITIKNLNRQQRLYAQGFCPLYRTDCNDIIPHKWVRIRSRPTWETLANNFQLTFQHRFSDAKGASTYFAFCYPWSYKDCQNQLGKLDKEYSYCKLSSYEELQNQPKNMIYYHRELLINSLENRRVDLVTITDLEGIKNEREEIFDERLFPYRAKRPWKFQTKKVFFVSSRVHPGETPASHVFNGFLEFILRPNDKRAIQLRKQFIFKLIPLLNPDGVFNGHYRTDTRGVNLNRVYLSPDFKLHPSIYASKSLLVYHHISNSDWKNLNRLKEILRIVFENRTIESLHLFNVTDCSNIQVVDTKCEENYCHVMNVEDGIVIKSRSEVNEQLTNYNCYEPREPAKASMFNYVDSEDLTLPNYKKNSIQVMNSIDEIVEVNVLVDTDNKTGHENISGITKEPFNFDDSYALNNEISAHKIMSKTPAIAKQHYDASDFETHQKMKHHTNNLFPDAPLSPKLEPLNRKETKELNLKETVFGKRSSPRNVRRLYSGSSEHNRKFQNKSRTIIKLMSNTVNGSVTIPNQFYSPLAIRKAKAHHLSQTINSERPYSMKRHKSQIPLPLRPKVVSVNFGTIPNSSDLSGSVVKNMKNNMSGNLMNKGKILNDAQLARFKKHITVHMNAKMGHSRFSEPKHLGNEGSDDDDEDSNAGEPFISPTAKKTSEHLCRSELLEINPYFSGIAYYIDLHGHCSKRGCFVYGNNFEDEDYMLQNVVYPMLISLNSVHFDFVASNFTTKNMYTKDKRDGTSKEGAGRVAMWKHIGIIHSYTLECNYNMGRCVNAVTEASNDEGRATPPYTEHNQVYLPKYTPAHYKEVGRSMAIAALDMSQTNPWSRVASSTYQNLTTVKEFIRKFISQRMTMRTFQTLKSRQFRESRNPNSIMSTNAKLSVNSSSNSVSYTLPQKTITDPRRQSYPAIAGTSGGNQQHNTQKVAAKCLGPVCFTGAKKQSVTPVTKSKKSVSNAEVCILFTRSTDNDHFSRPFMRKSGPSKLSNDNNRSSKSLPRKISCNTAMLHNNKSNNELTTLLQQNNLCDKLENNNEQDMESASSANKIQEKIPKPIKSENSEMSLNETNQSSVVLLEDAQVENKKVHELRKMFNNTKYSGNISNSTVILNYQSNSSSASNSSRLNSNSCNNRNTDKPTISRLNNSVLYKTFPNNQYSPRHTSRSHSSNINSASKIRNIYSANIVKEKNNDLKRTNSASLTRL